MRIDQTSSVAVQRSPMVNSESEAGSSVSHKRFRGSHLHRLRLHQVLRLAVPVTATMMRGEAADHGSNLERALEELDFVLAQQVVGADAQHEEGRRGQAGS